VAERIVVVGASNVDLISYVPRLPAPGETLHGTAFGMGYGGKSANQALMAARLGSSVTLDFSSPKQVGEESVAETPENGEAQGIGAAQGLEDRAEWVPVLDVDVLLEPDGSPSEPPSLRWIFVPPGQEPLEPAVEGAGITRLWTSENRLLGEAPVERFEMVPDCAPDESCEPQAGLEGLLFVPRGGGSGRPPGDRGRRGRPGRGRPRSRRRLHRA
jgi:hypothetical protein